MKVDFHGPVPVSVSSSALSLLYRIIYLQRRHRYRYLDTLPLLQDACHTNIGLTQLSVSFAFANLLASIFNGSHGGCDSSTWLWSGPMLSVLYKAAANWVA